MLTMKQKKNQIIKKNQSPKNPESRSQGFSYQSQKREGKFLGELLSNTNRLKNQECP
jgi:hypothetical protein